MALALAGVVALVLLAAPSTAGAVSFLGPTDFGAGSRPFSVAVGDFNGDTVEDLAVANALSNDVSVLLGNGDGTFDTATNFGTGTIPLSVAVGDFNGDAVEDLATANSSSDDVSVLLGNGDGTFDTATNFDAGDGPFSVAVGDFDGDTVSDLATANANSDDVSVLLGNGDGTFDTEANFGAGNGPFSVAVGDFDGDAVEDLATANGGLGANSVSVLLGNGDGTFGQATNFGAGNAPESVTVGDFDGDTIEDLATANANSDDVSVLLGNGDGTFGTATNFGAGDGPVSVAVGDFDGDTIPDLAVTNSSDGNVSVLLGNGDGTFGPATNFAAGNSPESVAIGDFDANTIQDLAVANSFSGNVSILLGVAPAITTQATAQVTVGQSISDTATLSGGVGPTGTITFTAYGPDDTDCSGPVAFTADVAVDGNGDYTSPPFTPTTPGDYRWVAAYSGDGNNGAVSGACNDPGETSVVARETPALATQATAQVTIGQSISDTATLSGGIDPTGTITFTAYGPDDANCSGPAAFTADVAVNGNGEYTSPPFTPTTPGDYRWVAAYSGDETNDAVSGACNDPGEISVVTQPPSPPTPPPPPPAPPVPAPPVGPLVEILSPPAGGTARVSPRGGVSIRLACMAAAGEVCRGTVELAGIAATSTRLRTPRDGAAGGRPARGRHRQADRGSHRAANDPDTRARPVRLGRRSFAIAGGERRRVQMRVNARARRTLSTRARVAAQIVVRSSSRAVITSQRAVLRAARAPAAAINRPTSLRATRSGQVSVHVFCHARPGQRCRGTLKLSGPNNHALATTRISLPPARKSTVTLRLSRAARRQLQHTNRLPARAQTTTTIPVGLHTTRDRTITIHPTRTPPPHPPAFTGQARP